MAELSSSVKTVIEVLHDGHEGFAKIGEHLEDPSAKAFFIEEAQTRAKFEHEVKHAVGVATEDIGGTAAGGIHRAWGDLKAHLGGDDHTLLDTAEQGEDAAKKAYKEALQDQDIHSSIREILVRQQSHIAASHDKVRRSGIATNSVEGIRSLRSPLRRASVCRLLKARYIPSAYP